MPPQQDRSLLSLSGLEKLLPLPSSFCRGTFPTKISSVRLQHLKLLELGFVIHARTSIETAFNYPLSCQAGLSPNHTEAAVRAAMWPCLECEGWRTGQSSAVWPCCAKPGGRSKLGTVVQRWQETISLMQGQPCSQQSKYPKVCFPGSLSILVTYQQDFKCISVVFFFPACVYQIFF